MHEKGKAVLKKGFIFIFLVESFYSSVKFAIVK